MTTETLAPPVTATRSRMVWMDALRGLAIILIVLLHATEIARSGGVDVSGAFIRFNAFMGPFRIPLLMVLSGMLLGGSLNKGTGRYLSGKVRAIVWPYIVWSVILVLVFPFLGTDSLIRAIWAPGTYLWYLHTLFICYLVALAMRRVPPLASSALALAIALMLDSFAIPEPVSLMNPVRIFMMLACFFAGHWIMQQKELVLAATRRWWVIVLLALFGVGLGLIAQIPGAHVSNNPLLAIPLVATICAGIGVVQQFSWSNWLARWIRWIGRHSIIYYVSHWITVVFALRLLGDVPDWRGFVLVPLLVGAALLVGAILALAERWVLPVRWLFRV